MITASRSRSSSLLGLMDWCPLRMLIDNKDKKRHTKMEVDLKNITMWFQEKGLEGHSNQVKFPFRQVLSLELAC